MSLPAISGRKYFSATIMNEYSRSLLTSFAWAKAPRSPFSALRAASTGDPTWSGFILYTGDTDTFRYKYNQTSGGAGATSIKLNNVTIHSSTGNGTTSGTVDISGSLTAGTVYPVVMTCTGTVDPYWLGLSKTINYTAPPTFSSGCVLAASDLDTIRTSLCELESAWEMPHTPNVMGRVGQPGHHEGYQFDGTEVTVWRGFFYHTHDQLKYRFRHGIDGKTLYVKIYYNSVLAASFESTSHDTVTSGSFSVAGSGLVSGSIYECKVTTGRSGTSNDMRGFCWMYEMAEFGTATVTPPPVWEHGASNITATNLNRYGTIIRAIHPGATSPSMPLYYEQPALRTDSSGYRYYIQHRRKWLRVRLRTDVGGKTAELEYGPNLSSKYAITSASGNVSFDMTTVPRGITVGQYFSIEDCEFAVECDSQQP